jgi:hypothetical protein
MGVSFQEVDTTPPGKDFLFYTSQAGQRSDWITVFPGH